jgi:hypothetical protein
MSLIPLAPWHKRRLRTSTGANEPSVPAANLASLPVHLLLITIPLVAHGCPRSTPIPRESRCRGLRKWGTTRKHK